MGQSRFVAILGGAGFIGTNIANRLRADGHRVRIADLPDCDLRYQENTHIAVEGCDYVIHLAADMGGVGYFHAHDYYPAINNTYISLNVLRACEKSGVERLFYASSACAYPTEGQRGAEAIRLDESMLDAGTPDQMYGREKLNTLRLCERAPFDARVGIFHTIYGPHQERSGERMKFPSAVATKALACVSSGGPLALWGDGTQKRSYLYVDDAVDMILAVLFADSYNGPVNIGYDGAVTCDEVARTCLDIVGSNAPITHTDDGPTGVTARDCNLDKFVAEYGIVPQIGIAEGFERFIEWLSE